MVLKETAEINMQTLTGSEPIFGRNLTGMRAEPVAQLTTGANKIVNASRTGLRSGHRSAATHAQSFY